MADKKKVCRYDGCERGLYDEEYCIFHSKDIEGKKEQFEDEFWKEFERQKEQEDVYNFHAFVFPEDISFKEKEFNNFADFLYVQFFGSVYFGGTKFSGGAEFRKAQFSGIADFSSAKFVGDTYFQDAEFSVEAQFGSAKFFEEANFYASKFPNGANFSNASFNKEAIFSNALFSRRVNYEMVRFSGLADFCGSRFYRNANFSKAQFVGNVNFGGTKFFGNTFFKEAEFSGNAEYLNTQFSGYAGFEGAKFTGYANFMDAQFLRMADFLRVKFNDDSNFTKVYFKECNMSDTSFYNVFGLLEYLVENRKKIKHPRGIKYLFDKCKPILGEATVSRLPLLSREIRDDVYLMSFKEKHPQSYFLWWLFADCGRSFTRWALWSLIFAFLFALIYIPAPDFFPNWWTNLCNEIGPQFQQTADAYKGESLGLWSGLYFSIVTFTTLGFGDVVTANTTARVMVTIEVILGYIMLGGLISILANKLARRS